VVIAALSGSDSHHRRAKEFFASTTRSLCAISAVSVGEVLIRPAAAGEESVALFLKGLDRLVSQVISFQKEHAELSASIRAKHKITFVDSMIIATAIENKARLLTFDKSMKMVYERIK